MKMIYYIPIDESLQVENLMLLYDLAVDFEAKEMLPLIITKLGYKIDSANFDFVLQWASLQGADRFMALELYLQKEGEKLLKDDASTQKYRIEEVEIIFKRAHAYIPDRLLLEFLLEWEKKHAHTLASENHKEIFSNLIRLNQINDAELLEKVKQSSLVSFNANAVPVERGILDLVLRIQVRGCQVSFPRQIASDYRIEGCSVTRLLSSDMNPLISANRILRPEEKVMYNFEVVVKTLRGSAKIGFQIDNSFFALENASQIGDDLYSKVFFKEKDHVHCLLSSSKLYWVVNDRLVLEKELGHFLQFAPAILLAKKGDCLEFENINTMVMNPTIQHHQKLQPGIWPYGRQKMRFDCIPTPSAARGDHYFFAVGKSISANAPMMISETLKVSQLKGRCRFGVLLWPLKQYISLCSEEHMIETYNSKSNELKMEFFDQSIKLEPGVNPINEGDTIKLSLLRGVLAWHVNGVKIVEKTVGTNAKVASRIGFKHVGDYAERIVSEQQEFPVSDFINF